jgi:hypothetical protein
MSVIMFIYAALLFFLLTPAILIRIPPNGNKYTVAIVHALVFALIWQLTHKWVWKLTHSMPKMNIMPEITASQMTTPPANMQ